MDRIERSLASRRNPRPETMKSLVNRKKCGHNLDKYLSKRPYEGIVKKIPTKARIRRRSREIRFASFGDFHNCDRPRGRIREVCEVPALETSSSFVSKRSMNVTSPNSMEYPSCSQCSEPVRRVMVTTEPSTVRPTSIGDSI